MDIEGHYQQVLTELTKGHRALIRFSRAELQTLEDELRSNLDKTPQQLEKILCLIEHSAALHSNFASPLLELFKTDHPPHILVFALNCARKHIIQACGQKGQRLSFDFLETLKRLLHHSHPEVVEWTLRTIEECGSQSVYFLQEFDKIKPPPWKWFNAHQRAVREIIELLERRWGKK
jgi:hypothetical protein